MCQQWRCSLIHRQNIICGVAFARSSLRRMANMPQSSLLGALHLTSCRWPGTPQNLLPTLLMREFDGGFGMLCPDKSLSWVSRVGSCLLLCQRSGVGAVAHPKLCVRDQDFSKSGRNRLKAGQYVISRRVKKSRNKKGRVAL